MNKKFTTCVRCRQKAPITGASVLRRGMTLVEMLVAMTAALIMMALVAQIMAMFGRGLNGSRKQAEMYDKLRAATERLKQDLDGLTVEFSPPVAPERGIGYFEYVEGTGTDRWQTTNFQTNSRIARFDRSSETAVTAEAILGSDDRLVGDVDDVLLFTTRSTDSQFVGKLDDEGVSSPVGEVVWYCRHVPGSINPSLFHLCRRQLIVMGHPTRATAGAAGSLGTFSDGRWPNLEQFTSWNELLEKTDVSCRIQNGYAIPNTLGDLTKRENRFSRETSFPYAFDRSSTYLSFPAGTPREGQDIILSNCIGFDVRVLDETTPMARIGDVLLAPDDPGYAAAMLTPGGPVSTTLPTYVDLDYEGANNSVNDDLDALTDEYDEVETPRRIDSPTWYDVSPFQTPGVQVGTDISLTPRTYDTWSTHYETNGADDDGDTITDEGHDRLDNNANSQIDESLESETSPPYPVPLRGVEVRVRCYEPFSKRVLQITIRQAL